MHTRDALSALLLDYGLTHYKTTNFISSKLKEFADDDFKFDENGRKLSNRVGNTVGKGDVTSNFSFSHSVFKRLVSQGRQKVGYLVTTQCHILTH